MPENACSSTWDVKCGPLGTLFICVLMTACLLVFCCYDSPDFEENTDRVSCHCSHHASPDASPALLPAPYIVSLSIVVTITLFTQLTCPAFPTPDVGFSFSRASPVSFCRAIS